MRQLGHDIKTHRLAAALFLVFWLAIWGFTVATWTTGMNPLAVRLHLLMPFVAGALAGWWRNTTAGNITGGMLAGLLFCVINWAIYVVFDRPGHAGTPSEGFWGMALLFGLLYAGIGIVLGMVGGIISALLAAALHRVRGGGGPAAPPGVS
jgi:small-conductance mechanosensitive channel